MTNILMERALVALAFIVATSIFCSCSDDSSSTPDEGNWVEKSDFEGSVRSGAVAFQVNGIGYVGTGYNGTDRLNDFWSYDPARNTWVRIADFPGVARNAAVAFSVNGKGYVGTGFDGTNYLKDFYEYDPLTNEWTQIPDFEGPARHSGFAFEINSLGYIGAGFDGENNLKDFWSYDPVSKVWNQRTSVGGAKRISPFAFVIDGHGYVGGGSHNGVYQEDFWMYDPGTDSWDDLDDLDDDSTGDDDILRSDAVSFVCYGKAYVTTGSNGGTLIDTWMYDPALGSWTEVTAFEGASRQNATVFTIDDVGYVLTGRSGSIRLDDIWAFFPLEAHDDED